MDLRLYACQGCPITISNRVENRNWLVLVSLTRWRTNCKIISVSNRPVSRCPMSQGAPVSPRPNRFHVTTHARELMSLLIHSSRCVNALMSVIGVDHMARVLLIVFLGSCWIFFGAVSSTFSVVAPRPTPKSP